MESDVFCLGCGRKTSVGDRRLLRSDASSTVLPLWETILDTKLQELGKVADKQVLKSGGFICRTCYRNFEKYRKLQESLLDSMGKAIAVMCSGSITGRKRPRSSDIDEQPCSTDKRPRVENTSSCIAASSSQQHPSVPGPSRLVQAIQLPPSLQGLQHKTSPSVAVSYYHPYM